MTAAPEITWLFAAILFVISAMAAFTSGLLGIGGGVVLAPMLLYLPPLVGGPHLDMTLVSGLTITQSLASSLLAARVHGRFKRLDPALIWVLGSSVAISSFIGAWASKWADTKTLLCVFGGMAVLAAGMILVPPRGADLETPLGETKFNRSHAIAVGLGLGLLGGFVGQTGSFLLIPAMVFVLRVPMRIAVGSSLGVVLIAAVTGTAGKALAGHFAPWLSLCLVPGAFAGTLGGRLSQRMAPSHLRIGIAAISLVSAGRIFYGLLAERG